MDPTSTVTLVPVPPDLRTSYGPGVKPRDASGRVWAYGKLLTAGVMAVKNPAAWRCTPGTARALLALDADMKARGSAGLRLTEVCRPWRVQAAERSKLEHWWAAGKPKPGARGWNEATMRTTFVTRAGEGNHNWGAAIDIDVEGLDFPGVAPDRQLAVFWELAAEHGFRPIIAHPNGAQAEAWHFDHVGPLQNVYDMVKEYGAGKLDPYAETARAGCVLTGVFEGDRKMERLVQARLLLAGHWCGPCDGLIGPTTMAALKELGLSGPRSSAPAYWLGKLDELGVDFELLEGV